MEETALEQNKQIITKEISCPAQNIRSFVGSHGSSVVRDIYRKTGCMVYINQELPQGALFFTIELSGLEQEVIVTPLL